MDDIIPGVISIALFMTIAGIWATIVLTRHKERMTMIDKGLKSEDIKALYEKRAFRPASALSGLKWGLVFLGIGCGVIVGILMKQWYHLEDSLIIGLIPFFGGLGLVVFYFIARKQPHQGFPQEGAR